MSYSVYVLFSVTHTRTYTGQTEDMGNRLKKHNEGKVRSTKAYRPWALIHTEDFETRAQAMEREKWLKTTQGRKFIAKPVNEWKEANGLSV